MKTLLRCVFAVTALVVGVSGAQALPACAPMDFDGDCKSDILWRHGSSGQDYLWLMNGLTIASQGDLTTINDPAWIIAGVGDFDGDGKADILWRNTLTGENYLWLMNGLTVAARGQVNIIDDPAWQIQGIADFDGDGRADILWRNASTGENYMYLMNGWTIVGRGLVNVLNDLNWQIKGIGDFDGDGKADILWRNYSTGQNYMYLMNGWTIVSQGQVNYIDPADGWDIRAIGDFDGDGRADIWWRHNATGQDYVYFMKGWTMGSSDFAVTAPDVGWMPRSALTVADGAGPDTKAPSTPTGLAASAASTSQINLSWNAASDN